MVAPLAASRSRITDSKSIRGRTAAVAAIETTAQMMSGNHQLGRRAIASKVGPGDAKTPATRASPESADSAGGGGTVDCSMALLGGRRRRRRNRARRQALRRRRRELGQVFDLDPLPVQ